MKCLICNSDSEFLTRKNYEGDFKILLEQNTYMKCPQCGFSFSKTIQEMSDLEWEELNFGFHKLLESQKFTDDINQPPYIHQANLINILSKLGLIDLQHSLDYAGGHGTLTKILRNYYGSDLPVYDPYVQDDNSNSLHYIEEIKGKKFKFINCSALFEHIRSESDLDEIASLVDEDGVLMIHTVICENIPADPNWFYFVPPVHSAFFTNKSMDIWMEKWNFSASVYCKDAKSWLLFKKDSEALQNSIKEVNSLLQSQFLIHKKGFVDYWKGF